jgi:hypothetical protein
MKVLEWDPGVVLTVLISRFRLSEHEIDELQGLALRRHPGVGSN